MRHLQPQETRHQSLVCYRTGRRHLTRPTPPAVKIRSGRNAILQAIPMHSRRALGSTNSCYPSVQYYKTWSHDQTSDVFVLTRFRWRWRKRILFAPDFARIDIYHCRARDWEETVQGKEELLPGTWQLCYYTLSSCCGTMCRLCQLSIVPKSPTRRNTDSNADFLLSSKPTSAALTHRSANIRRL